MEAFCTKNEDFDQIYLNTGSKTQNVEKLSLDLIKESTETYLLELTPYKGLCIVACLLNGQ